MLCGVEWFTRTFEELDPDVEIFWHHKDGEEMVANTSVCEIEGRARALLTAGALAVWVRQDRAQALTWLAEGEALAQAVGDERSVATALFWRTSLAEEFGDDVATVLAGREAT